MSDERYLHLVRPDCPLPPGTHVVAYCRDSGHEEQDRSVSQQTQAMREYCAHHQLILERIYIDEARVSSNTERRDQLNEMLLELRHRFKMIHDRYKRERQMEKHPFGVICWKSNRLSRDSLETTHIKADLRMRGITIISMIASAETSDPGVNALIESFQHFQDEKELDEISENSRRGLAQLVGTRDNDPVFRQLNPDWETNDGRYLGIMPGVLPTGFRAEVIKVGINERRRRKTFSGEVRQVQRAVPDHENNLWERCYLAWKMRHEGDGAKQIMEATHLFKSVGSYSTFFSNRIYTGDFEYGGKLYVDFVPALIPREWYEEEQRRREERAAKLKQMQSDPMHEPRRVASRHLLTGLVFCGAKEGEEHPTNADTVPAKQGKRSRWDFYICSHKKSSRDTTCDAGRIGAAALDEAVIENLMTNILTRENLRPIANTLAESLLERNVAVNERIVAIQGQLEALRKSITQLLDAIEKVGLSTNIQTRLAQRETEERDLIAQLANLEDLLVKPKDIPKITDEKLDDWIKSIRESLQSDDVELARRAVRQFVAKIVVKEKKGTIYYTFPLSDISRNGSLPLMRLVSNNNLLQKTA